MITVCCHFTHSFKTMARRDPVAVQAVPPSIVQALLSGRGGEDGFWFTRFIEGREPEIYELWTFAEDGTREVHPFARIQISDDFAGENFLTDFVNEKSRQVAFFVRISVNVSVQWLYVSRPF